MAEEKTVSQELYAKAAKAGKVSPGFLDLKKKVEVNGEEIYVSNGVHIVKFLSDKQTEKKNPKTKEMEGAVEYLFSENGLQVKYQVFAKNRNGELNYFIEKMSGFKVGDMISLEFIKKEGENYGFVDIKRADSGSAGVKTITPEGNPTSIQTEEEIPVIEQGEDEINTKDIPF